MDTAYLVHDAEGRILRHGRCPAAWLALQAREGEFAIEASADEQRHYVDLSDPELPAVRSKQPLAERMTIGGRVVTITDLPVPCAVAVERARYEVPDGAIEIAFTLPGRYRLTLEAIKHLSKTLEVELA